MFDRLRTLTGRATSDDERAGPCPCEAHLEDEMLTVDATGCEGGAALAASPACRATAIGAAGRTDLRAVRSVDGGRAREYRRAGPELVTAGARFADLVAADEPRLATRARRDPLGAAAEAVDRAGDAERIARDAGLARFAEVGDYASVFTPRYGLTVSEWRIDPTPPPASRLVDRRRLETGATVRIYAVQDRSTRHYHLSPLEATVDDAARQALADAYEYLAAAPLSADGRATLAAVRAVSGDEIATARLARVLRKHCHECGLLRDLFADQAVSDAFVTAPAGRNDIRVRVDGETMATNVSITDAGVAALASRFRRESGRGFSRAQPTLDAATAIGDRRVRVAGVTEPVSDGQAFAFRAHDRDVWTVPALVANETLSARAAGFLSVCAERGVSALLAGPRGSGKTTTLGALLWEIPWGVRTVVIENAPELPIASLQDAGRDVQGLRADQDGALAPAEALRSALRLGDGALVVGEIRGEEAGVLYEAMRVGANSEAVLGTIHGDGGGAVFERVVSDLGVPPSSFGTTDLVVSQETTTVDGERQRRVRAVEELVEGDPGSFASLFERTEAGLTATGRLDRGNSHVVASLAGPAETYADVQAAIRDRTATIATRARTGRTSPREWGVAEGDPPLCG